MLPFLSTDEIAVLAVAYPCALLAVLSTTESTRAVVQGVLAKFMPPRTLN